MPSWWRNPPKMGCLRVPNALDSLAFSRGTGARHGECSHRASASANADSMTLVCGCDASCSGDVGDTRGALRPRVASTDVVTRRMTAIAASRCTVLLWVMARLLVEVTVSVG